MIISVFWGSTRSADPGDPSLWESSQLVAALLLGGGLVAIVAGVIPIVVLARRKGRHTRPLEAYGVRLDPSKTHELPASQRAG